MAVLPGEVVAQLFIRFGSRLLEANVRSFLSARGKVNTGIRRTLAQEPEMFLAYNNGLTTTAASIELVPGRPDRVMKLHDWQIVNGGQTTASLATFVRSDRSNSLAGVFVQVKLVVVDASVSEEVVQSISRYANSQNRVSDADFFSNSPFHRRVEELSQRVLAPARGEAQYQTRWFYERTRGQYQNERSVLTTAALRRFDLQCPRAQVITKTDLAKYAFTWLGRPHVVSQGAQTNFLRFAEYATEIWDERPDDVNELYFRQVVAQAIVFHAVRTRVMKSSWYLGGYLANIVTYAVAKLRHDARSSGKGEVDLGLIWQQQAVTPAILDHAETLAQVALAVLDDPARPTANVTQWAKQEQCWARVRDSQVPLPNEVVSELSTVSAEAEARRESRAAQKQDSAIGAQAYVVTLPKSVWQELRSHAELNRHASPVEVGILDLMLRTPPAVPSDNQCQRLLGLLNRAVAAGLIASPGR
jgi:hypothetical protein